MNTLPPFLASPRTKHKVFISYHHGGDQYYRERFETLFGQLFINRSVKPGDISDDVSNAYIKRLIQENYISDASVVVVLCGPETYMRKHVDWEISAALNSKVGGYSGLVGLILPTRVDHYTQTISVESIPARLSDNFKSGFAKIYNWSEDSEIMQKIIDDAFERRGKSELIENSRVQMAYNKSKF